MPVTETDGVAERQFMGPVERRPATVTAAGLILTFMAVAWLVNAIIWLAGTAGVLDRFREAAARTGNSQSEIDSMALETWFQTLMLAALVVAIAGLLTGLGLGILRGSRGARIATWVVTGVVEIGYCWILGRIAPTGEETTPADDGGLEQTLWNAYPEWWDNLFVLVIPLQMLGQIAVIPLLTAPSANRYFHPPLPDDRLPYPAVHYP